MFVNRAIMPVSVLAACVALACGGKNAPNGVDTQQAQTAPAITPVSTPALLVARLS